MDDQHKLIIAMINDLDRAICDNCPEGDIANLIDRLRQYTFRHLQEEEQLLRAIRFDTAEYHHHVLHHNRYRQRAVDFSLDLMQGAVDAQTILVFLNNWWKHHIMVEDQKYAEAAAMVK